MNSKSMLLFGMPNSGKSTIAYGMVQRRVRNALVIDGDKHREMQFLGEQLTFSKADIMRNTQHVVKLARFAQDQGFHVLIAQIAPYVAQRELMAQKLDNFTAVYCECDKSARARRDNFVNSDLLFEVGTPDVIVNTEILTIEECVESCLGLWGFV